MADRRELLLVTHVPLRPGPRGPLIDDQTAAGIAQWCRHFDGVTFCGVEDRADPSGASSSAWVDTADRFGSAARIVALPRAYRLGAMMRAYRPVRALLREAVAAHEHLGFTFGGLVGDWPALAAREAIRQKRRYAAWIDRVEAPILRNRLADAAMPRRIAGTIAAALGEGSTRHLIRRSAVALLQGRDTFNHYARFAADPHCTYDTHTQAGDRITVAALAAKRARILSGGPLRLVYAGRASAMKGPFDWLDTLDRLRGLGVPFHAVWLGDGPDLPAMRARVAGAGLAAMIELPGFEGNRERLLEALHDSEMLLFCHKTPESARCLIEALVGGAPLVGYASAYARGLVEARGGGAFVPPGDAAALAGQVAALHRDRPALARLVTDAAASGELYDEDSVYTHRAGLMRRG
jgi:glycosyltransferase involved in cell wall biosynthesis